MTAADYQYDLTEPELSHFLSRRPSSCLSSVIPASSGVAKWRNPTLAREKGEGQAKVKANAKISGAGDDQQVQSVAAAAAAATRGHKQNNASNWRQCCCLYLPVSDGLTLLTLAKLTLLTSVGGTPFLNLNSCSSFWQY